MTLTENLHTKKAPLAVLACILDRLSRQRNDYVNFKRKDVLVQVAYNFGLEDPQDVAVDFSTHIFAVFKSI